MAEKWKTSKPTQRALHDFNQKNATLPADMKEAKRYHTEIMGEMESGMKGRGWGGKHEFTGSSYEGTKIDNGNEFDVMRVQKRDDLVVKTTHIPGYVKLEPKAGKGSTDSMLVKGHLSADKFRNKFKGDVQRTIDSDLTGKLKVKLVDHGPAIQLNGYRPDGSLSHSTDYVPAVEVNGRQFVAKGGQDPTLWRESYSVKEKQDLKKADHTTLRTLKAMREQDPVLQGLDTYSFKSAVLTQSRQPGWDQKAPAEKITETTGYMKDCIQRKQMPSYSNKKVNLLEGKSDIQLQNVGKRLEKLSVNEGEFMKVLTQLNNKK